MVICPGFDLRLHRLGHLSLAKTCWLRAGTVTAASGGNRNGFAPLPGLEVAALPPAQRGGTARSWGLLCAPGPRTETPMSCPAGSFCCATPKHPNQAVGSVPCPYPWGLDTALPWPQPLFKAPEAAGDISPNLPLPEHPLPGTLPLLPQHHVYLRELCRGVARGQAECGARAVVFSVASWPYNAQRLLWGGTAESGGCLPCCKSPQRSQPPRGLWGEEGCGKHPFCGVWPRGMQKGCWGVGAAAGLGALHP